MKNPPELNLFFHIPLLIALIASMVLVAHCPQRAYAADFRHAKKIIVPPSAIPRRYDYDSMSGTVADPSGNRIQGGMSSGTYTPPPPPSSSYTITYPSSSSSTPVKNKNGLVPPPPPVAPSLLPSSMTGDLSTLPKRTSTPRRYSPHAKRFDPKLHPYGKSQTTASAGTDRIITRAESLEASGHLKEAQDLLKKNLKAHPNDNPLKEALARVSNERAKYYLRKDQFKEAAGQARTALQYVSDNKTSNSLLNQALRHQGIDPLNSQARLKEAQLLFTQGKLNEAEIEYKASSGLKPNAQANIGLGNIAFNRGHLKNAKESYQKALKLEPQSSVALRQLGITRYKLSDVVGANADLTRALVQDPSDKLASQNLIDLWQRQVATRPDDANSHLGLARAYQLSGDLDSAKNEYRAVVKIDPEHPSLPQARQSFKLALARKKATKAYLAGQTLYAHQAYREAFDKASEAVRLSPGNIEYKIFQAGILEKLGDLAGAKQAYLTILQDDPKNVQAAKRIQILNLLLARGVQNTAAASGNASQLLAGAAPQYRGEGPALPYLPGPYSGGTYKRKAAPGPTADPVQNMTGFLGSLRNLMQQQKKVLQSDEDKVLENLGYKGSSSGSTPSIASITSSSTSSAPVSIDKTGIEKVLAEAKAATAGAAAGSATSSAASAASVAGDAASQSTEAPQTWTEMAIAAGQSLTKNSKLHNIAQAASSAAPSVINGQFKPEDAHNLLNNLRGNSSTSNGDNPASKAASSTSAPGSDSIQTAPAIVKQTNNDPPLAPPIRKPTSQAISTAPVTQYRLGALEEQNRKLMSQLNQAQKQIEKLKASTTTANKSEDISESVKAELETPKLNNSLRTAPVTVPEGIKPVDNIRITQNGIEPIDSPKLRPAVPTTVPEGIKPVPNIKITQNGIMPAGAPNLRGAIPVAQQIPLNKQVHLELLGVKASSKKIRLKVRLRNEQSKDLVIPRSKKAVVRMAGVPDKEVKIKFPKKLLKANSSMEGYISVPGKRLSPAADVFIPELADSNQNIHLTVPISSLPLSH